MCDICMQHPCHPRCPNAPEPEYIDQCCVCGRFIKYGEEYVDENGVVTCLECDRLMEDGLL